MNFVEDRITVFVMDIIWVFLFLEVVVGSGGGTIADDDVCGGLGLVCIAAAAVVLVTCFGFFTYLLFLA
jgi:hypothetical protein